MILRALPVVMWCTGAGDRTRQARSPGRRSATGETYRHAGRTTETQKAHPTGWALHCLMPGSLWRASCLPPSGPLLRNVQIRSRRICPTLESAHRQTTDKTKSPVFRPGFLLYLMPGSSLLTWGDPTLPSALRRFTSEFGMGSGGTTALVPPGKFCFINTSPTYRLICIRAENLLKSAKTSSAL